MGRLRVRHTGTVVSNDLAPGEKRVAQGLVGNGDKLILEAFGRFG